MSFDATNLELAANPESPATSAGNPSRAALLWQSIERFLSRAGDWLNPILVKETRQAIKSSQFTITFVLVLAACWVATIAIVAWIGPRIFYSAEGSTLLAGYLSILAFPLIIVVPLASYRSLIAEREDNTYDLLSITTLRPRQIISGKLGSSIAQMAVYFSAIMPCLAFTYLLRGVDLPTIALVLTFMFFWSLGLSMVGILLATLTLQRFLQVLILVAFVAGLIYMFLMAIAMSGTLAYWGRDLWSPNGEAWYVIAALATAYFTTFALAYFAAAGMITFTSENRSTPLRLCMLIQCAAFIGWMSGAWIADDYAREAVFVLASMAGAYWYAMGTMLTAERPTVSQRVRRRLPQSFLGRIFLSWLNPGPGTGYMFVVANLTALAILCWIGMMASDILPTRLRTWPSFEELSYLLTIGWGYIVAYLGIGLLIVGTLRRFAFVTMLATVLIQFLLLLAGFGIPYAIKSMSLELRDADYSFLQITDPFFTLYHLLDGGSADGPVLVLIVPGVALCVLLLNMPRVVRELRIIREAAPQRVAQDEAELHPPPEALPQSPWDEPA
ncbi:MAG: hypothetical protein IT425_03435 [Pirellulales bacterium]|nr:hypothetical protein [Pirellulales bacterium]